MNEQGDGRRRDCVPAGSRMARRMPGEERKEEAVQIRPEGARPQQRDAGRWNASRQDAAAALKQTGEKGK